MAVDVAAAEQFIFANARVLDRHRLAVLMHDAPVAPVLDALRAYRNPDGGFGHALEPDVRAPQSETAATLAALSVLAEIGALDDPMVDPAGAWVGRIADPDGALPFVLPTAAGYPHAPWMVPSDGGSHLTFAIAGALWEAGSTEPWFLGRVPDASRAATAIENLRSRLDADGAIPVPGGTENERLTPIGLSERPGARSRALFTDGQIEHDLDVLERGQQDDGGWTFDWLAWSPGQSVEWRGALTLRALAILAAHGRVGGRV